MLTIALALFLFQAKPSIPPAPAAQYVPNRQIAPEKSSMKPAAHHRNAYPCRDEGDMQIVVHEKGGYTTVYYTMKSTFTDLGTLRAMPTCADPNERDGK